MEFNDYLNAIRKRWIAVLLFVLLGLGGAFGYNSLVTPVYASTAQGFVSIGADGQSSATAQVYSGAAFALQRVKSYVELVKDKDVLEPVIDDLDLDVSVAELSGAVSAATPNQTVLLQVTVTGTDPVQITDIANAVAKRFAEYIEELETTKSKVVVTNNNKPKTKTIKVSPVEVAFKSPAQVPASPISPRTNLNLALGLVLGLVAGIGWAIVRELLDNTVKSPQELEKLTGTTSLGVIAFDKKAAESPLVALDQQAHRAEAFRTIRTNLQYVDVDNPPRVVAITSPMPSEGKTTTACNLAITLAQSGSSVCLVEGDLRRPKVTEYLGVDNATGLTDVLAGQATLDDVLLEWHRELLTVLPAGPLPPNPSELLSSRQMQSTLADLKQRFDIVVIDAAPVLPVTDGALVAAAADGAVLVFRHGHVTRDQVSRTKEALDHVGAHTLGVVLNFAPNSKRGGYGYGYSYDYGYSTESAESSESAMKSLRKRVSASKSKKGKPADAGTPQPATTPVSAPAGAAPADDRPASSGTDTGPADSSGPAGPSDKA